MLTVDFILVWSRRPTFFVCFLVYFIGVALTEHREVDLRHKQVCHMLGGVSAAAKHFWSTISVERRNLFLTIIVFRDALLDRGEIFVFAQLVPASLSAPVQFQLERVLAASV